MQTSLFRECLKGTIQANESKEFTALQKGRTGMSPQKQDRCIVVFRNVAAKQYSPIPAWCVAPREIQHSPHAHGGVEGQRPASKLPLNVCNNLPQYQKSKRSNCFFCCTDNLQNDDLSFDSLRSLCIFRSLHLYTRHFLIRTGCCFQMVYDCSI
jgi:hypothetical protein